LRENVREEMTTHIVVASKDEGCYRSTVDEVVAEAAEARVERLVLEYAQNLPTTRPLDARLSLRNDLAIESLSLVSLTLRLGDELGVDVLELGLELGEVKTLGDLVMVANQILRLKKHNSRTE